MHIWLIGLAAWSVLIALSSFIVSLNNGEIKWASIAGLWLYVTIMVFLYNFQGYFR